MLNHLVTFVLGEQRYALRLASVHRVLRMAEVTSLPQAPDVVVGVIDLQGEILPVLSMRKRFGLSESKISLTDQLIVADTPARRVVLIVNAVTGLIERTTEEITEAETIVPGAQYVEGIARLEDGLVFIHNLDRCFSPPEEQQLDKALTQQAGRG
jgi:purine-binding chemotaxis protein CheW